MASKTTAAARNRRRTRIRKRVRGTATRPRLAVYRSNVHIYAQVIDDNLGHTLAAASTKDAALPKGEDGKVGAAKEVGKLLAERAKAAGIESVVFDRGGNRYAGRIAALADGAREGGLDF